MDPAQFHPGEIMKTLGLAGIDRVVMRSGGLDHLAEGGEGVWGQWFDEDRVVGHGQNGSLAWRLTSL
ncbi:hypothetical protein D3C77_767860 [compost metagenome]